VSSASSSASSLCSDASRDSPSSAQHADPSDALPPSPYKLETVHTSDRIGNYILGKTLGEGAFAKVKLGTHTVTGLQVAIKIISKADIKEKYVRQNLYREAEIMRKLSHPHIIKLYEIIETKRAFCLVTELASGGEVLDYIVAHGSLPEKEVRKYIRQLVQAVDHLHNTGVIHRCVSGNARIQTQK
jgi:serine/threonine protein kinase